MSETEHKKGRAIPFNSKAEDAAKSEWFKRGNGETLEPCYDSFLEALLDYYRNEYAVSNGVLFFIRMEEIDPYDDIANVQKNSDGSYSFEFKYYNGGTCFEEMFEVHFKQVTNTRGE